MALQSSSKESKLFAAANANKAARSAADKDPETTGGKMGELLDQHAARQEALRQDIDARINTPQGMRSKGATTMRQDEIKRN